MGERFITLRHFEWAYIERKGVNEHEEDRNSSMYAGGVGGTCGLFLRGDQR